MTRGFEYTSKYVPTFHMCLLSPSTEQEEAVKNFRPEDFEIYKII